MEEGYSMDYKRIYEAFIADRRTKQSRLILSGKYFERHHILPLSILGTRSWKNVVCLSYEDHAFAHALLAKIWRNDKWYAPVMANALHAVLNNTGPTGRTPEMLEKARRRFPWWRDLFKEKVRGRATSQFNPNIETIYHLDGTKLSGTRQELIEKTGLGIRLYDVVSKKNPRRQHCGWFRSKEDRDAALEEFEIRKRLADERPKTITVYHIDGRVMTGVPNNLATQLGVDRNMMIAMRRGKYPSVKGWHC